jgi:tRNA-specific adenosine deaminase 3
MQECNIECLLYSPTLKKILTSVKVAIEEPINPISHPIMNLIAKYSDEILLGNCITDYQLGNKIEQSSNECLDFTDQYFCEGLYVFTIHETCPMCTMALVHSRIARLYFLKNDKDGALETALKINSYENLNHEFLIFKLI